MGSLHPSIIEIEDNYCKEEGFEETIGVLWRGG